MTSQVKTDGLAGKFAMAVVGLGVGGGILTLSGAMVAKMAEMGSSGGWQIPAVTALVGAFYAAGGVYAGAKAAKQTKNIVSSAMGNSFNIPS